MAKLAANTLIETTARSLDMLTGPHVLRTSRSTLIMLSLSSSWLHQANQILSTFSLGTCFNAPSSRHLIWFLLVAIIVFSKQPTKILCNPIEDYDRFVAEADNSTLSLSSPKTIEEIFRAHLKNVSNQTYIDTLTQVEVDEHRKTGRLPKRTLELIAKLLNAQEKLQTKTSNDAEKFPQNILDLHRGTYLSENRTKS